MSKLSIRLPGNDYPYNNVEILDGAIDKMGEEKFRFSTVSKAGIKRVITRYPDGTIIEETEEESE